MENVVTVGRVVPDTYFYPRKNGKKLFAIAKNTLNDMFDLVEEIVQ